MSIENPTLSAAAVLAPRFRHFIRRGGFSSLFTNFPSTPVEIALQISSILTNKPKVKYAKINVSSYETSRYVHVGHLVIQTNKAKQSQFKANSNPIASKGKIDAKCLFTMDYEENRGYGQKKQTQNKPNQSQFQTRYILIDRAMRIYYYGIW